MNDLRTMQDRFARLARSTDDAAFQLVEALADIWVTESQRTVPVDTGQLRARTNITSITSSGVRGEATLQADTPYAGYVEYGTRYVPPRPFFRDGRDAAARAAEQAGSKIGSEIRRALDSGGVWNPRSLI